MDMLPDSRSEGTEFSRLVRDALNNLYDHVHLQRHPLTENLSTSSTAQTRAQVLRRILLDAIEMLNPGSNIPLRAPERRSYTILFGSYVEKRNIKEIAGDLGISERQFHRERTLAIEALASILRDRYLPQPLSAPEPVQSESRGQLAPVEANLRQQIERMPQERSWVDIQKLFGELMTLLSGMAGQRGILLDSRPDPDLPPINLDRTLARNFLISLASLVINHVQPPAGGTPSGAARLLFVASLLPADPGQRARTVAIGVSLQNAPMNQPASEDAEQALATVHTLAAALDGRLDILHAERETQWLLRLPMTEEVHVLVVDDSEELFALFQRYTAGSLYRLQHAPGVPQALKALRLQPPDVIILDLMMPQQDGWELLYQLRSGPERVEIPIIICSVLKEPQLALSLGAQFYIKKPVEQHDLLTTLDLARGLLELPGGSPGV